MGWRGRAGDSIKRVNPESILTKQVREILRMLRIPHVKIWGGPMSERGIPDLVGSIPGRKLIPAVDAGAAMGLASSIKGSPVGDAAEAAMVLARRVVELEARARPFFCELKTERGTLSEEQRAFLDRMTGAGAVAFMARSAEAVIARLAAESYEPASRMSLQMPSHAPAPSVSPPCPESEIP